MVFIAKTWRMASSAPNRAIDEPDLAQGTAIMEADVSLNEYCSPKDEVSWLPAKFYTMPAISLSRTENPNLT